MAECFSEGGSVKFNKVDKVLILVFEYY